MYTIIGTANCGKCNQVKQRLEKQKIPYIYLYFQELPEKEQDRYLEIARQNNIQSFPLIFDEFNNLIKEI